MNDQIQTDPADIARHFRNFFENLSTSSPSSDLASVKSTIPDLENKSFVNSEDILDTLITFEEIEGALNSLKLGRSGGMDCLDPEHIFYGGETLKLWLKKLFNRIIALEEIPTCLNERLIIPVYKGNGKDPLLPDSYRGITLSSVITKLFEIVLLQRLTPFLEEVEFPDFSPTAYQKGISCSDAIFEMQERRLYLLMLETMVNPSCASTMSKRHLTLWSCQFC